MTRIRALAGACAAALAVACALAGTALADGTTVAEGQSATDDLWHLDVTVTFTSSGSGQHASNTGAGTVRVTLPGMDATYPMAFDQAAPAEPPGYSCRVVTGAYGQPGSGFECAADGRVSGSGLVFPTEVTLHMISSVCYAFPAAGAAQPAVADVWAAPGQTGAAPDATFALSFDAPCRDQGPAEPEPDDEDEVVAFCKVPKVRGLTLARARAKLAKAGCRLGRVKLVTSSKVKAGRVIRQSPPPGRRFTRRARVNLVVSRGPKR